MVTDLSAFSPLSGSRAGVGVALSATWMNHSSSVHVMSRMNGPLTD